MRWFKHLTRAHLDDGLSAMIANHGLECYGFYWILAEVVAEAMDKSDRCHSSHPIAQWSRLLCCHHHKVVKYFDALSGDGLIEVTQELPDPYPDITTPSNHRVTVGYALGRVRVRIPNLLKYRDEYSKKSGECPESVRTKIQIQKQREKKPSGASAPSELDSLISEAATRIHQRHPDRRKDCSENVVRKSLATISKRVPAAERIERVREVDANHAALCATEEWTKDGGEFAKGLENWLRPSQERYLAKPNGSGSRAPEIKRHIATEIYR